MSKLTAKQVEFIFALTLGIGFMLWMATDLYNTIHKTPPTKIEIAYDCRLAEISPDYPQIVKEKCRKLMKPRVSGVL
jgi:hypothetical protein